MSGGASYHAGKAVMTAGADGLVLSHEPVLLPIMAPRLQADCHPDGMVTLALWGAGTLGTVAFTPLGGPFVYGPNRVTAKNGGVHVAQTAPTMVIRGAARVRVTPAKRAAWWHERGPQDAATRTTSRGTTRICELAWGSFIVEQRGSDLVLSVGASTAEAQAALGLSVGAIVAEAEIYARLCDRIPEADPTLRSMVIQGTHAALSSIRQDEHGSFAGLAAGQAYSAPARTYFRDGYWTLQPLLQLAPDVVRDQIRLLATGIQPDGEAPSGVILSGPAQSVAWDKFRRTDKVYAGEHLRPGDWWSDHFDSPLFFILTLGEYVAATGDIEEARRHWTIVRSIVDRYIRAAGPDGLPKKPNHDRDWADNVYREGLVAYNIGLWVGALDAVVELGKTVDPVLAETARFQAELARVNIDCALWVKATGNYADFVNSDGFAEDHLTLDSLTLLRYRAVSDTQAKAVVGNVERRLESRHNGEQPYGDWGVLCAYPPFKRAKDVRAKSAFAFRYHNGSDWPYLDGLYAEQRLRLGLKGARYALTRWWEACLASGWAGAIEYYSPPFGRGSLLQGWSGLPAHIAVQYRDVLLAEGDDKPASIARVLDGA
jgi:hypothetical protein